MPQTTEKVLLLPSGRRPDPFAGDQAGPLREERFLRFALVTGSLVLFGLAALTTSWNAAPQRQTVSPETREALYLR